MQKKASDKAAISIRLEAALKKRLERLAKKDRRVFSQYVVMVLEDHADNAEKEAAKK